MPQREPKSDSKGRLLEKVAALMHGSLGVQVKTRVRLPAVSSRTGKVKKREIDVLLTASIAGYPVRIAIECKNEAKRVSPEQIDAFVGKLKHVGIPPQHGIFVSVSGYSSGAVERASDAGIRPLIVSGLSKDRLSEEVLEALQSVVYILERVRSFTVTNDIPGAQNPHEMLLFSDSGGRLCGSVPHLIWGSWLRGDPASTLGTHIVKPDVPKGWHQRVDGRLISTLSAEAEVEVVAYVLQVRGTATHFTLANLASGKAERSHLAARFPPLPSKAPLDLVRTEDELSKLLRATSDIGLVNRIRLPRIQVGQFFWPPTHRATEKFMGLLAQSKDEATNTRVPTFEEVEGRNIMTAWDSGALEEGKPIAQEE